MRAKRLCFQWCNWCYSGESLGQEANESSRVYLQIVYNRAACSVDLIPNCRS